MGALMLGLVSALSVQLWGGRAGVETWWRPWLLPSYGIAFMASLFGRVVQRSALYPRGRGAASIRETH